MTVLVFDDLTFFGVFGFLFLRDPGGNATDWMTRCDLSLSLVDVKSPPPVTTTIICACVVVAVLYP